ncbi:MAG: UDP-N-acetylmuramate--L-alanine ligase [Clostridia bacterium]|nr:UDP-N-acetylmuramate--L-alanine ligase [Clostridia bacterium]
MRTYEAIDRDLLNKVRKLHFVGIGGSGMCPMAEILFGQGYTITGSDMNEGDTLDRIKSYGIEVHMGHAAENIGDAECVVYTAACKQDNPELVAAREKGIPTLERSEMLGLLTDRFDNCIGISGTHGKTSTTGMTTQILLAAGEDPSCVIGGKLPLIGGNGRFGKTGNMVVESCEYVDSFLTMHPAVSVILNIDADHLDYFGTLDNIIASFRQFCMQTSRRIIVNADDKNAMKAVEGITHAEIITFGSTEDCDYYCGELIDGVRAAESFTIFHKGEKLTRVNLKVPGAHNMMNAMAAAAACLSMGVSPEAVKEGLEGFGGVHRRFEVLGKFDGVTVADDFAHHPTELRAVLTAASKMGYHAVWAVFQPHTYSRTALLFDDFVDVLKIPEHVVMTEILAVRETNTYNIYTSDLEAQIPGSCHFGSFDEIADYVMGKVQENDLILTIGGGDIYKCANLIVEKYKALGK